MARYTEEFVFDGNQEQLEVQIQNYMDQEGFKLTNYKGEEVFKKGYGILTGPEYLKVEYFDGTVVLGAWIKFALLPGVFLGETGITGAFGAIPKKKLKKRVTRIIDIIQEN